MPANIREEKEKELGELRSKAKAREASERERKTVLRYRMLKFIGTPYLLFIWKFFKEAFMWLELIFTSPFQSERQKVGRRIKHGERDLRKEGIDAAEKKRLEEEVDRLKDDLLYIAVLSCRDSLNVRFVSLTSVCHLVLPEESKLLGIISQEALPQSSYGEETRRPPQRDCSETRI